MDDVCLISVALFVGFRRMKRARVMDANGDCLSPSGGGGGSSTGQEEEGSLSYPEDYSATRWRQASDREEEDDDEEDDDDDDDDRFWKDGPHRQRHRVRKVEQVEKKSSMVVMEHRRQTGTGCDETGESDVTRELGTGEVGGGEATKSNLDLLGKVFPQMSRGVLELILDACNQDLIKSIEQVLRSHGKEMSTDALGAAAGSTSGPVHHHGPYSSSSSAAQRYLSSAGTSLPFNPYAVLSSKSTPFSFMSGLAPPGPPSGLGNPADAALRQAYSPAAAAAAAARGLALTMPYGPAAFMPNFAGFRYNYSAMMAAMVASASTPGGKAVGCFPYGVFPSQYKTGSSEK